MNVLKIDDLLSVAGGTTLKSFDWGLGLVAIINMELTVDEHITGETTGTMALAVVRGLSPGALMRLFTMEIDIATGKVVPQVKVAPPTTAPVVVNTAVTVPTPSPQTTTGKNWLALMMGVSITLMALMMALALSISTVETGKTPDSSAMTKVLQVFSEVASVFIDDGKSTAPASAPPSVPVPDPTTDPAADPQQPPQ